MRSRHAHATSTNFPFGGVFPAFCFRVDWEFFGFGFFWRILNGSGCLRSIGFDLDSTVDEFQWCERKVDVRKHENLP